MKILLTGHEGYIGSNLLSRLEEDGHRVITIDGDILEIEESQYYGIYDFIIHLAAFPGVRKSIENPDLYLRNNVEATRTMFRIAEKNSTRILYASSSNAKEWWSNPYATTKKINELDASNYDIRSVGMRFHTVWPGRPDMLYQRLHGNEVKYINENHTRDFIFIDDLIESLYTTMLNFDRLTREQDNVVLDYGTGHSTSVKSVAERFGFDGKYMNDPTPHERTATKADADWLYNLGWAPTRNILL